MGKNAGKSSKISTTPNPLGQAKLRSAPGQGKPAFRTFSKLSSVPGHLPKRNLVEMVSLTAPWECRIIPFFKHPIPSGRPT